MEVKTKLEVIGEVVPAGDPRFHSQYSAEAQKGRKEAREAQRRWKRVGFKILIFMIPVEIQGRGVCGRWNPLALSCKFVLGSVFYPGKGECLNSDKLIVWAP